MLKPPTETTRGKHKNGLFKAILGGGVIIVCIVVGLYYCFTHAPVKMPVKPIASAPQAIVSLPAAVQSQAEPGIEAGEQAETGNPVPDAGDTAEVSASAGTAENGDVAAAVTEASASKMPDPEMAEKVAQETQKSSDSQDLPTEEVAGREPGPEGMPAVNSEAELTEVPAAPDEKAVSESPLLPAEPESSAAEATALPLEKSSSTVPADATIEVGEYVLQAELLRDQTRLKDLGFAARVEIVERPTPISRVFLGPFPTRQEAETMLAKAKRKGDEPFLLLEGDAYKVIVGSFYQQDSVVAWKELYCDAGFKPEVQKVKIKMPHLFLLLTGTQIQSDPASVVNQLKAANFPNAHLRP